MQQPTTQTQKNRQKQNKSEQSVSTTYCQPEQPTSWLHIILLRRGFAGQVIAAATLCCLTIATYLPSLRYPFQFDDLQSISYYFNIRHASLTDLFMVNRRWISYWLNTCYFSWDRFNPFIYRVGNLAFHLTAGLLVFTILHNALKNVHHHFLARHALSIATITAGLFLLHPVQTQTVSYVIQGQLEGLASLAALVTIALFFVYSKTQTIIARILIACIMLSFAAIASCTKEIFVVTPLLVMLFDWFFIAQGSWAAFKKNILLHSCLLLTVVGAFAYFSDPGFFKKLFGFSHEVVNGAGSLVTDSYQQTITSGAYIMFEFKVLLHYLLIFVWPFGLCVDYDCTIVPTFWCGNVLVPLFLLLTLGCWLLIRLRKNPTDPLVFGMLWFFVFVIPRSIIPSAELMNDYKTYGASIGLFFVAACGLAWLLERFSRTRTHALESFDTPPYGRHSGRAQATARGECSQQENVSNHSSGLTVLLILLPLCLCSWQRNKVWATEKDFWADVVAKSPRKARAYNAYGVALAKENNHKQARYYFQKAIELDPGYVAPFNNLAISSNALHDTQTALTIMKTMAQAQPDNPEIQSNLGSFLIDLKEYDAAEPHLQKALQLRPHYGKAYFHYGRLHFEKGNYEAAYEAFKNACSRGDFDTPQGFYFYGKICLLTNRVDEATQVYQKAYQLFPNAYEICFEYGNIQCMRGNFKEAQILYQKAYAIKTDNPDLLFNLGEAYWADQQYQQALAWFKKAEEKRVQNPALAMRLAGCYAMLGDPHTACVVLEEFLKTNPPVDLKKVAQHALAQLKK